MTFRAVIYFHRRIQSFGVVTVVLNPNKTSKKEGFNGVSSIITRILKGLFCVYNVLKT